MKVYTTDVKNMGMIRKLFYGYIFRNIKNGVGYVRCGLNQKKVIESVGIELTLETK